MIRSVCGGMLTFPPLPCRWCSPVNALRRAGGLLIDLGVLSIKPSSIPASYYQNKDSSIPKLPPSHPAIVEWRAMTVIELCVSITSHLIQFSDFFCCLSLLSFPP